jgi:miniconductance mechanosensitive channel
MEESGGRRIKRSIYLDITTIKFCSQEMVDRFKKIQLLAPYISDKEEELRKYNETRGIDPEILVNGRRMTNIGTFRQYVEEYLKVHPMIHSDMTFLVRQRQPSDKGLPLEIYVFSKDQRWANYESIQADIFDHIFAVVTEFELRVFQNPTGSDFINMGGQNLKK